MSDDVIARKNPMRTNIGKLSKYLSRSTPPTPNSNMGVTIMYPRLSAKLYADQVLSSVFFISCFEFLLLILFFVFLLF